MQAPQTAAMTDEGGRSRSSSLEKQRRFLGRDRYMGFQDEPLHGSDSGGRPEQAKRAASGNPLDVRDLKPLALAVIIWPCAATILDQAPGLSDHLHISGLWHHSSEGWAMCRISQSCLQEACPWFRRGQSLDLGALLSRLQPPLITSAVRYPCRKTSKLGAGMRSRAGC